jgi:hypothetical protein
MAKGDIAKVEETAVAKRLRSDPGLTKFGVDIPSCPVLIEFALDGYPTTFRARGAWWWFIVKIPGAVDELNNESEQVFVLQTFYDDMPAAGYMPLEQAYLFVEHAIALFRKLRELSPHRFDTTDRKLG